MTETAEMRDNDQSSAAEASTWRSGLRRRLPWGLAILFVCGGIFGARLLYATMSKTDALPALGGRREWHTANLPSLRGRILDRNGAPLAWSERWHCLVYETAATHDIRWRDMYVLQDCLGVSAIEMFGKVDRAHHSQVLLIWGLQAKQILTLGDLVRRHPRFKIETRFVRRYSPMVDARLRRQLGRTRQFGWREVGVSGWEAHFDRQLRGRDGKYRVQLNPDGSWFLESWEELRRPQSGYDVYLPFAVSSRQASSPRTPGMVRLAPR